MRIQFHIQLLLSVAIVTLALRFVQRHRYALELNRIGHEALIAQAQEIEAVWRKFSYTDVASAGFEENFIQRINWAPLQLSELQGTRLRSRLGQVLRYFREASFEEYLNLKTDVLHYHFKPTKETMQLLGTNASALNPGTAQNCVDSVHLVWNAFYANTNTFGRTCLNAVCLDRIAAAISHTNSPANLLKGKAGQGFTMAGGGLNPGFEYEDEVKLASEGGEPLFFQLSFFAKVTKSENAGPVYLSMRWLPRDQNWALSLVLADHLLGWTTLY